MNGQRTTVHLLFAFLVFLLGALQALWFRRTLNPDGVAYLDLSDAVLAGRWGELVQGYWSPLYPLLLAVARTAAGRGALHETFIAHGVNLAGYAFALGAWHHVLIQLGRRDGALVRFDRPLGLVAGYAVFAWAMLWLTSLHFVTPDLWLAGWVFAAAALVLRHENAARSPHSLALGAVLGAGYLTKSVLFPVAPFVIAAAALLSGVGRRARTAIMASAAFVVIAGPWVAVISAHEGRLTFGDNGRFNYAWFVTGDRWLSPDPVRETGPHAAVFPQVVLAPATYAWPRAEGTYAPWRDPSAWHGAMRTRFDAARQARVVERSWNMMAFYLAPWGVLLVVVLCAGAFLPSRHLSGPLAIAGPSVVGLVGYALVLVEGRYVAPFLALVIVACAAALRPPDAASGRRVALATALGVVIWAALDIRIPGVRDLALGLLLYLVFVSRGALMHSLSTIAGCAMVAIGGSHVLARSAGDVGQLAAGASMVDPALQVRDALTGELFPEARAIGVLGDGPSAAIWARQLRARIVAEVPASQVAAFWAAPDEVRTSVAHAMRAAGAREIIAVGAIPELLPPGWHRVSSGGVARYALDEP